MPRRRRGAFDGLDQVIAGGAGVVGAGAEAEIGFGGDQDLVAPAADGVTEDFLGEAVGIGVGGVKHIQAVFEADINEAGGFGGAGGAKGFEEVAAATEGAGAEDKRRDFEAGRAKQSVFHGETMIQGGELSIGGRGGAE